MPPIDSLVIEKAKSLGFLAAGFTRPVRPLHFDHFKSWLTEGKNADMAWLQKNLDVREDPCKLLANCKTIISLAYPYPAGKPMTVDGFAVARYANPVADNYHTRLKTLCRELASFIREKDPASRSRICVDSAPILERSIAAAAMMGFVGKNNLLITTGYGSFFYLAEILTTTAVSIPSSEPLINRCGSCSLCLDACPSGALEKPFVLNASRCLSYLTVEYKGDLNPDAGTMMGKCFFGCDRCQEVCPFNGRDHAGKAVLPSTDEFLEMDEDAFARDFGRTAFARVKLEKLKSNICAARKGC
jgi:epoxyqueuosine reductase